MQNSIIRMKVTELEVGMFVDSAEGPASALVPLQGKFICSQNEILDIARVSQFVKVDKTRTSLAALADSGTLALADYH